MDARLYAFSFALVASIHGTACAMNPPKAGLECAVTGGERLPAASGGATALCADVKEALAGVSADATRVTIRVISAHALAATVTVSGETLPEIRLDRSDRELSRGAFQRFAQSIAIASTSRRR